VDVKLVATDDDENPLSADAPFTITTVTSPRWQNPRHPYDLDNNGSVTPNDVLLLIKDINKNDSRCLPSPSAVAHVPPYFDPTGDDCIKPEDVIRVIRYINWYTKYSDESMPVVSIAKTADGNEQGPEHGTLMVRQDVVSPTDTVVNINVAGTATAGSDYEALPTSITIPAGQTSVEILAIVFDDADVEDAETIVVEITSDDPQLMIDQVARRSTVVIVDNDAATSESESPRSVEPDVGVARAEGEGGERFSPRLADEAIGESDNLGFRSLELEDMLSEIAADLAETWSLASP
jgi:hypothetical protein